MYLTLYSPVTAACDHCIVKSVALCTKDTNIGSNKKQKNINQKHSLVSSYPPAPLIWLQCAPAVTNQLK